MTFNHDKYLNIRGTEHLRSIHDVARAMNEIQADNTPILSLGKTVRIHRPAADSPLKWKLVKGEWIPR